MRTHPSVVRKPKGATIDAWCPICHLKLCEVEIEDKKVFYCPVDGEMQRFLIVNPGALNKASEAPKKLQTLNVGEAS